VQVSAPAGSGKTVLLRSWAHTAGLVNDIAWVSVNRQIHDPRQFWALLIRALRVRKTG
jgi:LuxR family transcriptional regulator, maltose regulon positive regulatory protein